MESVYDKLVGGSYGDSKVASLSLMKKRELVRKLFDELKEQCRYLPDNYVRKECGYDFRTLSMFAYLMMADRYALPGERVYSPGYVDRILGCKGDEHAPLIGPDFLPVRYSGSIGYDRIFSINRYAFTSPDSIFGIRAMNSSMPMDHCLYDMLKGMSECGTLKNWNLFKLDPLKTDDGTAMILLRLEKNFDLEFAHFPHDGGPVVLFRWIDS